MTSVETSLGWLANDLPQVLDLHFELRLTGIVHTDEGVTLNIIAPAAKVVWMLVVVKALHHLNAYLSPQRYRFVQKRSIGRSVQLRFVCDPS